MWLKSAAPSSAFLLKITVGSLGARVALCYICPLRVASRPSSCPKAVQRSRRLVATGKLQSAGGWRTRRQRQRWRCCGVGRTARPQCQLARGQAPAAHRPLRRTWRWTRCRQRHPLHRLRHARTGSCMSAHACNRLWRASHGECQCCDAPRFHTAHSAQQAVSCSARFDMA